jgi:hypothetical protein
MKIINNALQKEDFLKIKNTLEGELFSWYCCKGINTKKDNNFQFIHTFYNNFNVCSNYYSLLLPVIKILNPVSILRIKSNLIVKEKSIIEHGMHVDTDYKHSKTAIYYVNTNNGYTKFLNGKKITSEENKLLIFNTDKKHTGTTCTDSFFRIVINFNYIEYKTKLN